MISASEEVFAQASTVGPFQENLLKCPLPRPAFDRLNSPALFLWDMDHDGDLDASMGHATFEDQNLRHYRNVGTKKDPAFDAIEIFPDHGDMLVQWYGGDFSNAGRPALADLDDDGDMDMVIGMDFSDEGPNDVPDDRIWLYWNVGTDQSPSFVADFSDEHPFFNIHLNQQAWPAFTDYDKDGDLDFVLVGEYFDLETDEEAWVQLYKNNKNGHQSGVPASYTKVPSAANPLYMGPQPGHGGLFTVAFADLDDDGDEDYFSSDGVGQIFYKRNDNGVFVEQTGTYTHKSNGQSTGNPLSVSGLNTPAIDDYKSFAFGDLDDDGDEDLVVGTNRAGTFNPAFIYVENKGNGVMVIDNSITNPISGFSMGAHVNATFIDYDNDGDNDLLTTGEVQTPGTENILFPSVEHKLFRNNNGSFELQTANDPFESLFLPGPGSMKLADVDGDSDLDAVFFTKEFEPMIDGDVVAVEYRRNDNGTYVVTTGTDNPFAFVRDLRSQELDLDLGDLNGDGLADIVLIMPSTTPFMYKNTGTPGNPAFASEFEWQNGFQTESSSYHTKLVDIDNDGDNDLVVGKYSQVWYFENIGTSTGPQWKEYYNQFVNEETEETENLENPFGSIASTGVLVPNFGDIDGDGDMDLILANDTEGYFRLFENENPAPVVTPARIDIEFYPGEGDFIILDPNMTLADSDHDKIALIRVTIVGYEQGKERLDFDEAPPGLGSNWDDATGVFTVFGAGDMATYQQALRSIEYTRFGEDTAQRKSGRQADNNGRSFAKSIYLEVLDADRTVNTSNTITFNLVHSNVDPVVTPGTFNATYAAVAIPVIPTVALSDGDDLKLASAQVKIDSGTYIPAEDLLTATFAGALTGNFNAANGVLQISGDGTIADYQQTLRSVAYNNLLGNGATSTPRILTVKVNDGDTDSNIASVLLDMDVTSDTTVNTPPSISGAATSFYISGEIVINNNIRVTDPDTTLIGASVVFATGFVSAEDVLLFTDQNGITGQYNSTAGLLTLSGSATVFDYQAALRSVRYKNNSTTPSPQDRIMVFNVNDGGPDVSLTGTVITINKPPVIDAPDKQTAAGGNIAFSVSQVLSDPDNNLDLATLQVTSERGGMVSISSGVITIDYSAVPTYKGNDIITIFVCDTGGRCDTTTLSVEVGAAPVIYSGMSPNGDGINDWFHIEFAEKGTQVAIYNRWGDAVFESDSYDVDEPSQRFEGKTRNGTEVVAGSYFYKVKFPNGTVKTGYLLLNR